ncbi:hypothetical protein CKO44_23485 [Rubrivivax gelatinosus]|uniref:NAD(P)-binding domain-containing protein n=1 Tax=Rubrivivax gelatinosus TaxID=28068 RepID=A0ABS1E2F9_RUBGE|nr:hypothetical protein [Rubrivivax gelatinosus]MBK1616411.1 hypothetical protein [Rubrivivax gelatinosus]MBK1715591.1 hypothetical protein [Rubrivivax gelatinosus]
MADPTASPSPRDAASPPRAATFALRERALVLGAGGALGSALLAEALVAGRFAHVAALVKAPLASTPRGLGTLYEAELAAAVPPLADIAFLVFERERHANGRDEAFVQPQPQELLARASALHAAGVRRLVVVLPHAPALLPAALKAGFASAAEQQVAALGFEHCVFLRAAQAETGPAGASWLERVVALWLAQLRWMIPAQQGALRTPRLAQLVVLLARLLPSMPAGTRVVAPEALWDAAQQPDDYQAEIKLAQALARR